MPRLPTPGQDEGQWGNILNEFMRQSHNEDGKLKNTLNVINIKDFGAKGDSSLDPNLPQAISNAIESLPQEGGIIFFPPGNYITNTSTSILTLNSKNNITIKGAGIRATFIKQQGTGHGFIITDPDGIENIIIEDIHLSGNDTAGKGIETTNLKDGIIQRVSISSFLNHAIEITGVQNLHIVIRDCRITIPQSASNESRAIKNDMGNGLRLINNYFNQGKDVLVDLVGQASTLSLGNILDSNPANNTTGFKTSGEFTSIGDWFDVIGNRIITPYQPTQNAMTTIIGPTLKDITNIDSSFINRQYLSFIGPDQAFIGGVLRASIITPPTLTTDQNNYLPENGKNASIWRLSTNKTIKITGIKGGFVASQGPPNGTIIKIINTGANDITLTNQNTRSNEEYRLITGTGLDLTLNPEHSTTLIYDGESQRWRVIN